MLNSINNNGMIVVEDTHSSYMNGFGNRKYTFINYVKNKIDRINYRFHKLKKINSESRIWSLKIYESIVAICVNDKSKKLKSLPIENKGIDDKAKDYRLKKIKLENNNYMTKILKILRIESASNIKKFFK